MNYQQDNDYELLYMIYQRDDESLKLLVTKYEKIMYIFLKSQMSYMYQLRWCIDQYQIGRIILLRAIENYRYDKEVSFRHYFLFLLKNEFINVVRHNQIHYHMYEHSSGYLIYETGEDYLEEVWKDCDPSMQADYLVRCEETRNAILEIENSLNPLERKIVRLRLYGYTYKEITKILKVSKKKVDNTLYKVRIYKV